MKTLFSFSRNIIDDSSIEPILQDISTTAKENGLSRTMMHSLMSILSELLSNLSLHAFQQIDENSVSIEVLQNEDGDIQIHSRNFIENDKIGAFTILLNRINLMSPLELRQIQQETLERNLNDSQSPRIGLIIIRRRICQPIICSFEPFNDQVSYINLQMELKQNIHNEMLQKDQTGRTPQVNFNLGSQIFEISGVSFPEDAETYYSEIERWIDQNETFIKKLDNPTIKIDLDYFNSASLKNIVRTVNSLLSINKDSFTVNWYYDSDDEIAHDEGVEMSEILKKRFNFIQKD